MNIDLNLKTLLQDGFILVFNNDQLDVVKTAKALVKAGINNMEVTCRISQPIEKMKRIKHEIPEFLVGMASLVDSQATINMYNNLHTEDSLPTVSEAVISGADYLVSAMNFRKQTFNQYSGHYMMIPGCGSATEIVKQYAYGATFCKLFPAGQLGGVDYVKAIDPALHNMIPIIPTGGVTVEDIPGYIDAGILVLGGSFSMIEKTVMKQIIKDQDYDLLSDEFAKIKTVIDDGRKAKWPDIDFTNIDIRQLVKQTGRCFIF